MSSNTPDKSTTTDIIEKIKKYKLLIFIISIMGTLAALFIVSQFRFGTYKGLPAESWISFWSGVLIPVFLISIPIITLIINYKDNKLKLETEQHKLDIDNWFKISEALDYDKKTVALDILTITEERARQRGLSRIESEDKLVAQFYGRDPELVENGENIDRSADNTPDTKGTSSAENDKYKEMSELYRERSKRDLINALADSNQQEWKQVLLNYLNKSKAEFILQPSTTGKNYSGFTIAFNNKRVGFLYISKSKITLEMGAAKRYIGKVQYEQLRNRLNAPSTELEIKKPTKSEGYYREPIKFQVNTLINDSSMESLKYLPETFYEAKLRTPQSDDKYFLKDIFENLSNK